LFITATNPIKDGTFVITEEILLVDHVREDALVQTELTRTEQTHFKGIFRSKYEFSAQMRLSHSEDAASTSAFGILVRDFNEQEHIRIRFSKPVQRWALIVESAGMIPAVNRVLALPEDFDPTTWHILHLIQRNQQIHIHVDGSMILSINGIEQPTQPGLTTHNAAVEFNNIRQTASYAR
jgi:hypothetical protein